MHRKTADEREEEASDPLSLLMSIKSMKDV